MIMKVAAAILLFVAATSAAPATAQAAKEVALTFDDAPMPTSKHFTSTERTETLIRKLKELKVDQVMIFANPCKGENAQDTVAQLKKYKDAGHLIANHTCSHPRYDTVGFRMFSNDALKGDQLLAPLMTGQQKFFRYPMLNESEFVAARDQMRTWLKENNYRNGYVTLDNDDYLFSFKINKAKAEKIAVEYDKVKELLVRHILDSAEFYNALAIKTLGRSPKHVILLHEMDATVMFIGEIVTKFRAHGWKIISPAEAFKDPIYLEQPKNTYSNNGLIAQLAYEKSKVKDKYDTYTSASDEMDKILVKLPTDYKDVPLPTSIKELLAGDDLRKYHKQPFGPKEGPFDGAAAFRLRGYLVRDGKQIKVEFSKVEGEYNLDIREVPKLRFLLTSSGSYRDDPYSFFLQREPYGAIYLKYFLSEDLAKKPYMKGWHLSKDRKSVAPIALIAISSRDGEQWPSLDEVRKLQPEPLR